jgi:hypothetical protein
LRAESRLIFKVPALLMIDPRGCGITRSISSHAARGYSFRSAITCVPVQGVREFFARLIPSEITLQRQAAFVRPTNSRKITGHPFVG